MKTTVSKHELPFGNVIEHYYRAWGTRRSGGLLRFLIKAELAGFGRRNREIPGKGKGEA